MRIYSIWNIELFKDIITAVSLALQTSLEISISDKFPSNYTGD